MKILCIDFNIIMSPCIRLYADRVSERENPGVVWRALEDHMGIDAHLFYDAGILTALAELIRDKKDAEFYVTEHQRENVDLISGIVEAGGRSRSDYSVREDLKKQVGNRNRPDQSNYYDSWRLDDCNYDDRTDDGKNADDRGIEGYGMSEDQSLSPNLSNGKDLKHGSKDSNESINITNIDFFCDMGDRDSAAGFVFDEYDDTSWLGYLAEKYPVSRIGWVKAAGSRVPGEYGRDARTELISVTAIKEVAKDHDIIILSFSPQYVPYKYRHLFDILRVLGEDLKADAV